MHIIEINVGKDRSVKCEEIYAGANGENSVVQLKFIIPKEYKNFYKYLDILKSDGVKTQTVVGDLENEIFYYTLPFSLTKGKEIIIQLVLKLGKKVFISNMVSLYFNDSLNATGIIDDNYQDTIQYIMENKTDISYSYELSKELKNKADKLDVYNLDIKVTDFKETVQSDLNEKVDKERGMGLSEKNYTTSEKEKLNSLPSKEEIDSLIYQQENDTGNNISYGPELVTSEGWTYEGWTGNLETGFTHTVGASSVLKFNMENTGTNLYKVEFDVESPSEAGEPNASNAFTVILGNSERFVTYKGGGNFHYCYGIRSVSDGDFQILLTRPADPFTDDTTFDGTIKNISIKKVLNQSSSTLNWYDKTGTIGLTANVNSQRHNTYLGTESGLNDFGGDRNTALGHSAMADNTSGYWNTAVGVEALGNNTVGSRNVALGYLALRDNTTGDRNYAMGTFALARNTNGRQNIAIGADALWNNENGRGNIAIGGANMAELTDGNNNISIGLSSGQYKSGSDSVSVGYLAMGQAKTSDKCVAIGREALYKNESELNVGVGNAALCKNTTGKQNTALGAGALGQNTTALGSVGIGFNAGYRCNDNGAIFIGSMAGTNATKNNICIGYNAGKSITTGANNLIIGRNTEASSPTISNELNIANTLFGKINTGRVGIKNQTDLKGYFNIGAGDGTVPQIVLGDSADLTQTPIAGSIEYNGDGLYLTDKNLSRNKLSTESYVDDKLDELYITLNNVCNFIVALQNGIIDQQEEILGGNI